MARLENNNDNKKTQVSNLDTLIGTQSVSKRTINILVEDLIELVNVNNINTVIIGDSELLVEDNSVTLPKTSLTHEGVVKKAKIEGEATLQNLINALVKAGILEK